MYCVSAKVYYICLNHLHIYFGIIFSTDRTFSHLKLAVAVGRKLSQLHKVELLSNYFESFYKFIEFISGWVNNPRELVLKDTTKQQTEQQRNSRISP